MAVAGAGKGARSGDHVYLGFWGELEDQPCLLCTCRVGT